MRMKWDFEVGKRMVDMEKIKILGFQVEVKGKIKDLEERGRGLKVGI
ncbi:hypothetical protein [Staphylococcus aureus]